MFKLVIKDFYLQKSMLWFSLLYIIFILFLFNDMPSEIKYFTLVMTISYGMSITAFSMEEKSKSDILFNALPINRRDIVISKYLSIIIYVVVTLIFAALLGVAINSMNLSMGLNTITFSSIQSITCGTLIIAVITFPCYFKFGYAKGRIVSGICYMLIFFFAISLSNEVSDILSKIGYNLGFYSDSGFAALKLIIVICLFMLSMWISVKAYSNREFN